MKPAIVLHYRERGDGLFRAAVDLDDLDHELYAPAIGLLAVHACIALADAVLVAMEGERAQGEDHREAARRLRAWCRRRDSRMVGSSTSSGSWAERTPFPTTIDDDDRRVEADELRAAKVKMQQFFAWAFDTFPPVAQISEAKDA